ncbi:replication protein [Ligilactobacillus acidipiscis]|uniref:replication protein n=1 Tax=Ligilactobacillus acidipiscis TaxID=89059 RepID=UPI0023FA3532|nr:replication protein [Ligilactobacillus acidipiscis]WEV56152.1 replication protein [Ligilactobacillus acidipiscis]
MNNLLISEPPLQVLPSLAVRVGLNEAIVLQQFHYWLQRSKNVRDGNKWIYNSIAEWQKQFPFWSKDTVKRTINSLEKQGCLIVGNYNKAKFDKTKWYRINYDSLCTNRMGQNAPTSSAECTNGLGQNAPTNTNRLPETTTETTKEYSAFDNAPHAFEKEFQEVWDQYPNKKGKKQAFNHYKAWRKKSVKNTNEYLLEQLSLYKKHLAANPWKQPMNGATWFNGRFDDQLEVPQEQGEVWYE